MNTKNNTNAQPAGQPPSCALPAGSASVKLYEITAIITRSVVVAATSEAEAMEHVSTWEQSWETSSDLIGVSDVGLMCSRPLKASDWRDEAHEITPEARALLNNEVSRGA